MADRLSFSELVRHGRWIKLPESCQADYECSECGAGIGKIKTPYCAICGAKMDLRTPTEVQLDEADNIMMEVHTMADLLGNILVGYAVVAWDAGYRAEDRTMLGMMLDVSDDDLDTICKMLDEWEQAENKSN